jgi:hypothetical protein
MGQMFKGIKLGSKDKMLIRAIKKSALIDLGKFKQEFSLSKDISHQNLAKFFDL